MRMFVLLACLVSQPLFAKPFIDADSHAGSLLHQQHCVSCHASQYGGDGSAIYTRDDRKVNSANGLLVQVRSCNTNIGLQWFEDEELNVAAFLNQSYYLFTK